MTKRKAISKKIKESLLRETNYRCGYCMMNITPAAYFTENRNSTEAKDVDPTYYQMYDCAHIEPYNEEDPETNSFYNLIALCKNCHWKSEPLHNNAIITKEQLKALKLHWLVASGRFTRLEIDVLMDLYNAHNLCKSGNIKVYCPSYIHLRAVDEYNRPTTHLILPNGERPHIRPVFPVQRPAILLFRNIVNQKFVAIPHLPDDMLNERVLFYMPDTDVIFNTYDLELCPPGGQFCQNFHEAYKELDKIEI